MKEGCILGTVDGDSLGIEDGLDETEGCTEGWVLGLLDNEGFIEGSILGIDEGEFVKDG